MNKIINKNKLKNNKDINIKKKTNLFSDIYGIDKGVIELKLKDFKYDKKNKKLYINNNYFSENKGLIIFYAPWCKHCVKISNSIIDLAMSNLNIFSFGAVNVENVEDGNDYLSMYGNISRLPTIKTINNNGILENYKFEYNIDNLIFYVNTNI
jgi:thiol-disulfide isomerase/thioredoxin